MAANTFIINVFGRKPVEVQVGTISKTSGLPDAGARRATQEVGEIGIPNYSTAWGKLLRDKDKKLTGEIGFLPWGHNDGEVIEIRHMKNCSSISMEFQKEKKLVLTKEESEITLKIGQNKFRETVDKNLILLLKHHGLNRSNGSRNPDNKLTRFETYKVEEKLGYEVSDIEMRQQAEKIVLHARSTKTLETLAKLFGLSEDDSDEFLFKSLVNLAQNFKQFFTVLKEHADLYKNILTKAAEAGLIDLESESTVTIVIGGKKDVLMTDIEGDNADMRIDYITDNITEPMIYHALNRLAGELERYNSLVLN